MGLGGLLVYRDKSSGRTQTYEAFFGLLMKTDIWMPITIGDYMKDTTKLTARKHGIYFLLIMTYWVDCGLSDDNDELAMIAKVQPGDADLSYILDNFFTHDRGRYLHKRIEEELAAATARREASKENGKKGGRPPKNKPRHKPNNNLGVNLDSNLGHNLEKTSSSSSSSSSKQSSSEEKRKRFAPPSEGEVSEYCIENGYSIEAGNFVDFYSSKGWMVGKNKMKDWKAAVRTWAKRENSTQSSQQPQKKPMWDDHGNGGTHCIKCGEAKDTLHYGVCLECRLK